MKKIALLFLILLLVNGCADTKYQIRRPFLYEVKKGDQVGYLFGTMHKGIILEDLPPSFWPYFDKADVFTAEVDLKDVESFKEAQKNFFIREDKNENHRARKMLSAADYEKVKNILEKKRPTLVPALENASLLAVTSLLYSLADDPEIQRVNHGEYVRFGKDHILDGELTEKAKEQKKMIQTLDEVDSVGFMECFYGDSESHVSVIKTLLSNMQKDSIIDELLNMAWTYRSGNETLLMKKTEQNKKCVIEDRNKLWISKIDNTFKKYKTPFVAVGVGHLETKKSSLISLLKDRGYEVRRMNEAFLPEN